MRPLRSPTSFTAISTTASPRAGVDFEPADFGDEVVVGHEPVARAPDGLQEPGVLEGLDHARLHELGQAVAPLRARQDGEPLGRRAHDDAVGVEGRDGGGLADDDLQPDGPRGRLTGRGEIVGEKRRAGAARERERQRERGGAIAPRTAPPGQRPACSRPAKSPAPMKRSPDKAL